MHDLVTAQTVRCFAAGVAMAALAVIQPACAQAQQPKKEPTVGELVSVKKQSWSLEGFGNVFVANLTIENKNKFGLKDFIVECETYGGSGTRLSRVRKTVYETLPSGKAKSFKDINMGFVNPQSQKAGCQIIGALPVGYK